jgi:hypothetical protein
MLVEEGAFLSQGLPRPFTTDRGARWVAGVTEVNRAVSPIESPFSLGRGLWGVP